MQIFPKVEAGFAAYVAPAQARGELWRTGLAVVGFLLAFLIGTSGVTILFVMAMGGAAFSEMMAQGMLGASAESTIYVLSTFVGVFAGAWATVRLILGRPLATVFGRPRSQVIRNALLAAEIMALVAGLGIMYNFVASEPVPNMPFPRWLSLMVLAIPLILIQVTTEEVMFRGALQQQLAARYQSPWIWMVLPSVVFGALHYQPDTLAANAWIACASTAMVGLFAADLTARTGNLGAAIGLHFTNNFFAICVLSLDGPLSGMSLYVTPFGALEEEALRPLLLTDLASIVVIYAIYLYVVNRRSQA